MIDLFKQLVEAALDSYLKGTDENKQNSLDVQQAESYIATRDEACLNLLFGDERRLSQESALSDLLRISAADIVYALLTEMEASEVGLLADKLIRLRCKMPRSVQYAPYILSSCGIDIKGAGTACTDPVGQLSVAAQIMEHLISNFHIPVKPDIQVNAVNGGLGTMRVPFLLMDSNKTEAT
jgi:hypothetical protein